MNPEARGFGVIRHLALPASSVARIDVNLISVQEYMNQELRLQQPARVCSE